MVSSVFFVCLRAVPPFPVFALPVMTLACFSVLGLPVLPSPVVHVTGLLDCFLALDFFLLYLMLLLLEFLPVLDFVHKFLVWIIKLIFVSGYIETFGVFFMFSVLQVCLPSLTGSVCTH